MKPSPLFLLLAVAMASGQDAAAQAAAEMVHINRQSTQSTEDAAGKPVTRGKAAPRSAQASPRGVQPYDAFKRIPASRAVEPVFSASSGDLAPGTEITITSPSPDAVIYYTTDGWTPTSASTVYSGPIAIRANTRLQAIATEPQKPPSAIVEATYTVSSAADAQPDNAQAANGILAKGTTLRFVTARTVRSDTALPGDRIPLILDENVMAGGAIAVANGAPAEATVTRAERGGPGGKPGVIAFQVLSVSDHGITIPLSGILTLAAPDKAVQAQPLPNPTVIHVAGALPRGDDAAILPGMSLTATVAADTAVHP